MAIRLDAIARGVEYPQREEDELARLVTRRFRGTAEQWRNRIEPLLRAGEFDQALAEVDAIAREAERYSDEQVAQDFEAAADKVDRKHERAFWAGVAGATGLAIYLTRPGKVEQVTPSAPVPRRGRGRARAPRKRSEQVIVPPSLISTNARATCSTDGVRYISTLRRGVSEGLREQIRGAADRVARGEDLESVVNELAAKVRESGVPSKIPIRRLKKNGQPVEVGIEAHARLIARDQIGKTQAVLNYERAVQAGATHYIWRTQGDGKVRPEHAARNNTRRAYGVGEQPGQPIQCRCVAEPAISAAEVIESSGVVVVGAEYKEEAKALARAQDPGWRARRAR